MKDELVSSIVIAGKICSGKSTLAKKLSEKLDFPIASFGGYLTNYCIINNIAIDDNRDILQQLGEQFIRDDYQLFLNNVIEYSNSPQNLIFEGVRHEVIFDAINSRSKSFFSIFIDVPLEERFQRCLKRNRAGDNIKNIDDFIEKNNHQVEKETDTLKLSCDLIIQADYSIENILEKITNKHILG